MTEALKTLMETEVMPRSVNVFRSTHGSQSIWGKILSMTITGALER
jgi:hypothetical protein